MGKYGKSAELAANLLISNKISNPIEAWEYAVAEVFPDSESSRAKGCPRSTFLGLCEDGYIIGVEEGSYTRSEKNKSYALKAVSLLNINPELNAKSLWRLVIDGADKQHNSQMDVVMTLWNAKLINQKNIPILK